MNNQSRKFILFALIVSTALNAILLTAVVRQRRFVASFSDLRAGTPRPHGLSLSTLSTAIETRRAAIIQPDVGLKDLIASLKRSGYSNELIRLFITSVLDKRLRDQIAALTYNPSIPYWKQLGSHKVDKDAAEKARSLTLDKIRMVDALSTEIGGINESPVDEQVRKTQYGDMPPEKIPQVRRVIADYDELRMQASHAGASDVERVQMAAYIDSEMGKDLQTILEPNEMEAFELRQSRTAQLLTSHLQNVDVTEDEYRTLFKMQKEWDEKYMFSNPTDIGAQQLAQAKAYQLDEKMGEVLGAARAAQFMKVQDGTFRGIDEIASPLGVPPDKQIDAWRARVDAEVEAYKVAIDTALSDSEARVRLSALSALTSLRMEAALGEAAFGKYSEKRGLWLKSLSNYREHVQKQNGRK